MKKVIVYGNTVLSEMLYYEARGDAGFEIAAFCADSDYISSDTFLGLPLVDFDAAAKLYPPAEYDMIAVYTSFRQLRARKPYYQKARDAGYMLRNFISKRADVAPDIVMGDNNIVLAQAHLGLNGTMGSNNIIRQQVYLGHEFKIGSHNVISPGCNIAANCSMGDNCYIGIGATVIEKRTIADETLVGAASLILKDTEPYSKNMGNPARIAGYHEESGIMMGVRNG